MHLSKAKAWSFFGRSHAVPAGDRFPLKVWNIILLFAVSNELRQVNATSITCKLFREIVTRKEPERFSWQDWVIHTGRLRNFIARGELQEAVSMLNIPWLQEADLLLSKGLLTDRKGQSWVGSALQKLYWNNDGVTLGIVRAHLEKIIAALPVEERNEIILKAYRQLDEIDEKGLPNGDGKYPNPDEPKHFEPKLELWQEYINNMDAWDWGTRVNHWCKKCGGEESRWPINYLHPLCCKKSWDELELEPDVSLPCERTYYKYNAGAYVDLFSSDVDHFKELGDSVGLVKSGPAGGGYATARPAAGGYAERGGVVAADLRGLTAHHKVSVQKTAEFKEWLISLLPLAPVSVVTRPRC